MKHLFCLLFAFFLMGLLPVLAQIPNPDFENWIGMEPEGWSTTNVSGFAYPVQRSPISHSGASSVKGEIVSYFGSPWPANLLSHFPVSQRHATLAGYYQFHPLASADSVFIVVGMLKNGLTVGAGILTIKTQATSWTQFNIDILYSFGDIPDSASIFISLPAASGTVTGSYFLFDDLAFTGISDIKEEESPGLAKEFQLKQNYPNPFNPTTNIEFSIPKLSNVNLTIYNQLGQVVTTLVNEALPPKSYSVDWNAGDLPSGIYFYRITAGDFSETKKMILTR
jgi:hypothetical protein